MIEKFSFMLRFSKHSESFFNGLLNWTSLGLVGLDSLRMNSVAHNVTCITKE